MSRIRFGIQLPELPEDQAMVDEIDHGLLTVTIGEAAPVTLETSKAAAATVVENSAFVGPQGTPCRATYAYVDDSGNPSAVPSAADFSLLDTIPPANPGEVGAVFLEELPDEPPPV